MPSGETRKREELKDTLLTPETLAQVGDLGPPQEEEKPELGLEALIGLNNRTEGLAD